MSTYEYFEEHEKELNNKSTGNLYLCKNSDKNMLNEIENCFSNTEYISVTKNKESYHLQPKVKILVIGNGFDLFMGLETSYKNFQKHLEINKNKLYNELNATLKFEGENWNELEESLKKRAMSIDKSSDKLDDEIKLFNAALHTIRYELYAYLCNIKYELDSDKVEKIRNFLVINKFDYVLTYNYTNTLEKIADDIQFFHVHGDIMESEYGIILGYDLNIKYNKKHTFSSIVTGYDIIGDQKIVFYNNVDKVSQIKYEKSKIKNSELFTPLNKMADRLYLEVISELREHDELYIFGHSLSDCDNQLVESIRKSKSQVICSYREGDKKPDTKNLNTSYNEINDFF